MSEDQKQPQQPKGIGMVDLIDMYSTNKPSIDKSFAEFMTAMRPMFKGLPDFTDVKISDMKYSNNQAWDYDDINTLFGLVLEAETVRFDLIDARVDHMNEANWKTLDDLIEKKKLVVPGSLKLNKVCWQRMVAWLNRDKKSDEDADVKKLKEKNRELQKKYDEELDKLKAKYYEFQEKYDALEEKRDAFEETSDSHEEKYDALEEKYDELQAKYDALEKKCDEFEENSNAHVNKYDALEEKYDELQAKYDALEKTHKDLVDSLKPFKKQAASLIAAFKPATDST